ncbi:MAG: CVNH domain-containing protein [Rhizonema sp. NSF051]|nr:CVNH domain-containing protein [Rhizonema sp. NSF051]
MKLNLLSVIGFLATSTFVGMNNPANAAPSSYQNSCRNISISGDVLSADCYRVDHSLNNTSIELRGIENINGTLRETDFSKSSSYQLTCSNIHIHGNILKAICSKRDASLTRTSIALDGIENINGVLKYTSNP